MSRVNELHDNAMEFMDQAFLARRRGTVDLAVNLSRKAFELEVAAAELVKDDLDAEPTRSILLRSAASLALDCGELREAERLIATALAGNPPNEIAEELRNLLEQVHFNRHLELNHVDLSSGELQLSIAGNAIGYGIALSEVLLDRIKDIERLIYRTVERKLGNLFREGGPAKRRIQEGYSLYLSAPRAGSFAVTLKLGKQMGLPGFDLSKDIIDEVLQCLDLLNKGKEDLLKERIQDESYYVNFIGLAKRLAPDGDKVNLVGLTAIGTDAEFKVAMTRTQDKISPTMQRTAGESLGTPILNVTGRLLLADARKKAAGKIQLIEANGTAHTIIVPQGMMDDIVKPLWDEMVTVDGTRSSRGQIRLKDIRKASDDG